MEGKLNSMCIDCGHYSAGRCSGTHSQVRSGCCGKNLSPEEFAHYVDGIEKDIERQLDENKRRAKE